MKAYQIKIAIKNSHPPIWRRCIVPSGITFSQLSIILNKVMGWSGYHLFEFEFYHLELQIREDDKSMDFVPFGNFDLLEASETYINEYLEGQEWFTYTYDLGDDWSHRVTIEKVIRDYAYNYPYVIKYKGNCPMEDCGGIDGYYQTLEILRDESHPEHSDREDWIKYIAYDEEYDLESINDDLRNSCFVTLGKGDTRRQIEIYEEISESNTGLIGSKSGKNKKKPIKSNWHTTDDTLKKLTNLYNTYIKENKSIYNNKLADIFAFYDKEDIREIAAYHNIYTSSDWKKSVLIDSTVEKMLQPQVMKEAFILFRDIEIEVFEKVLRGKELSELEEIILLDRIYDTGYIGIQEDESIEIPSDVIEVYHKINSSMFQADRAHTSWLYDCFTFAALYYGVVPISVLVKVANQNKQMSFDKESLIKYFYMIPEHYRDFEIVENRLVYKKLLGQEVTKFLEWQGKDKPYYIPGEDEIADVAINGYFSQDKKIIDELIAFFICHNVSPMDAEILSTLIQQEISMGCELCDIFDILSEVDISFKNEKETQKFVDILSNVWNNTRTIVNRGYTPNEMAENNNIFSGIRKGKFKVDLDSNTTSIPVFGMPNGIGGTIDCNSKKIYPNDPCPCGSGKKYKKCCGR
ncbi:plasmid pRiA4b ORF-3 family protein [Candidatus Galacturonibacter soehngenii]|nr:plasmid pRiA4b ORF-3 family protein [Candidatus Galacturonibacter soehngenii]MBA4687623.1 SEC-C domain-containing protein [Candidatus Galacturonibacter soehngenii]